MGLTKPRAAQIFNLDYKQATRVVTTTNITLAGGAPSLVDGVSLSAGDRVLVTGQTTGTQNGLYYVTTVGSGSNGTWARTSDGNENGEIEAGMIVMVTEGVIYADTQWKLITDDPITIGTTSLSYTQNYMANSIAGGSSNVTVFSNANVVVSSAGTANVLTVSSTGTVTTGTASITGNITGGNISASKYIGTTVSVTGNVTAASTVGGVITGTSASVTANVTAGNMLTGGLISATGNTTGGNLLTGGLISATGNVTGNYFLGNVFFASGITASKIYNGTSEANVGTSGGNANISIGGTSNVVVFASTGEYVSGLLSVTGNITGGNSSATNYTGTNVSVTGTATAASTVGGVITGSSVSVSGSQTAASTVGGVITGTSASVTGTVTAASVVGGVITGSSTSVSGTQTAASTVGGVITGSSVSVNGNITGSNVLTGGLVSATGNVTGNYILGNVFYASGITASKIYNGTSEVNVGTSGGNANISIGGTSNVAVFSNTGAYFNGNLVPATSNTYSLGSSTNRWANLWLTGNTIYLGNSTITSAASGDVIIDSSGSFAVPVGSTAQRSAVQGAIRYNTTVGAFETYDGVGWNTLAYGTQTDFPFGDYGSVSDAATTDAFGVSIAATFDCGAEGPYSYTDLATGEAWVGA